MKVVYMFEKIILGEKQVDFRNLQKKSVIV